MPRGLIDSYLASGIRQYFEAKQIHEAKKKKKRCHFESQTGFSQKDGRK